MSNTPEISNPRLEQIISTLFAHRKLWLTPGLAALAMTWFYVYFVKAETYSARQSIIVRDDLLGQSYKPGRFDSLDSMKSAQETILEIARKPQVVRNALRRIGPSRTGLFGVSSSWPNDKLIEDVQSSITFSAPNGAEFGHTEVIVLSAKASARDRAHEFILALLDEIEIKTNEVRLLRLKSMEQELIQIRDAAGQSLAESSSRLRTIEEEVGSDLSTLRGLSDRQGGGDTLSQSLVQIRLEKRQVGSELDSASALRETLLTARNDPSTILATSDELFKFQPALNRLKQELIQAQSAYAASVGRYEKAHPVVMDNADRVTSMHGQIYEELGSAQRGLDSRISALGNRVAKLSVLENNIEKRLDGLSGKRVDYLRLDEEVEKKSEVFNEAQADLSKIQRLGRTDGLAGLLTRVDEPQVSTRADGLGKTTSTLAGGLAGLLVGLGLVLLLAPGSEGGRDPATLPPAAGTPTDRSATPQNSRTQRQPDQESATGTHRRPTHTPAQPWPMVSELVDNATAKVQSTVQSLVEKTATAVTNLNPSERTNPVENSFAPETPASATPFSAAESSEPHPGPQVPAAAAAEQPAPPTTYPAVLQNKPASLDSPVASYSSYSSVKPLPVEPAQIEVTEVVVTGQPSASRVDIQPAMPVELAKPIPQALQDNRGTGDSSGVPTAASILAALEKVRSPTGTSSVPIIQSESPASTAGANEKSGAMVSPAPVPDVNITPRRNEPGNTSDLSQTIEIQRRPTNQRPAQIAQQAAATDDNLNNAISENASAIQSALRAAKDSPQQMPVSKAVNPFLKPQANKNVSSLATDLDATIVQPIRPAPTEEDLEASKLQSSSTVPIPEQIRQLTDSISAFAKPIKRQNDEV